MALSSAQKVNDLANQLAHLNSGEMWQLAELLYTQHKMASLLLAADLELAEHEAELNIED